MGWLIALGIAAIIAAIVFFSVQQKRKWKKIYEDDGLTDEAADQYAYLQHNGVRSRLQQIPIGSTAAPSGAMMSAAEGPEKFKVRVVVHKDDYAKAQELLQTYIPKKKSIV